MKGTWMQWVKGIVTVQVRGDEPESFVNRALAGGLELWSIRRTSGGELEFETTVGHFFRMRPYLKRTSCRVHVAGREGMPFWVVKLRRRVFFAMGLLIFLIGMYVLSSLVWSVQVKGNIHISDDQILQAAEAEGIHQLQWSFKLEEPALLAKRLAARLPDAAWVGVQKKGTSIVISVVESTKPEAGPLLNPRHLIASANAVITEIQADAGRPVVKRNMRVQKGDILISGTIGGETDTQTVVAKGKVRGLVWHEYTIVSPLTEKVKVYTGESKIKWHLVLGDRALQVSGFGDSPFATFETVQLEEKASWRGLHLPVGRLKETVLEVRLDERVLSKEEAISKGIQQAKADLMTKAGSDAVVLAEKLLHEKTENGKVYLKVLLEVEQSIVAEMPLVPMQGE
ncbi:sporulation protein YqfD [Paenibacillus curdlanolyticus YK9]|uniref:Sporulation protein YqfD n=1 Tax=Paenibacillus curdlanolyticus YK9 TaxID=717606 RepID=E0I3A1_9BACL|nr:sporulation protein YqfD [Paenibacillus curdlanolyticus]EFM12765.1 sporulation protein YqfD [Paenibacillus curdlanolyticus YK9]